MEIESEIIEQAVTDSHLRSSDYLDRSTTVILAAMPYEFIDDWPEGYWDLN